MDDLTQLTILFKILGAAVLGGVAGLEREGANKSAGLRTYMLVAASAAAFVEFAHVLTVLYVDTANINADPIRVIQSLAIGVSFIGSGLIIKDPDNDRVRNLTTAASLLFAATTGMAVALELYYVAVGLTVLNLLITFVLRKVEEMVGFKQ